MTTTSNHISPGKGIGPPRYNTAWRAIRQSFGMTDEAIFEATGVFPDTLTAMRAHWVRLQDMGMAPLYSWDAERRRVEELAFHIIDRSPSHRP